MNQFEFECEFDGALQALSGIAESLHAAGADACVHTHDDAGNSEDTMREIGLGPLIQD